MSSQQVENKRVDKKLIRSTILKKLRDLTLISQESENHKVL